MASQVSYWRSAADTSQPSARCRPYQNRKCAAHSPATRSVASRPAGRPPMRQRLSVSRPADAHQHEQAGDPGDVVRLKGRKEVGAQGEQRRRRRHPQKPRLAQAEQKRRERQVERRQKEEAVIPHAVFQAQEVSGEGFRFLAAESALHAVIHLLLRRQLAVRRGVRLERQRGRHAVLILAERLGKRGPTARHRLVLEQRRAPGTAAARWRSRAATSAARATRGAATAPARRTAPRRRKETAIRTAASAGASPALRPAAPRRACAGWRRRRESDPNTRHPAAAATPPPQ